MPAIEKNQPNFTGGVCDPLLYSRVDLEFFYKAFRYSKNMIVRKEGGVVSRGGLMYVAEIFNSAQRGRLIPFSFSDAIEGQQYILEFTPGKIRFIRDGALVADGGGPTPYSLAVTYTADEIKELRYAQSADALYLNVASKIPFKLVRNADDDWSKVNLTFSTSISAPTITSGAYSLSVIPGPDTQEEFYVVTAITEEGEESDKSNEYGVHREKPWDAGEKITIGWSSVAGADQYFIYRKIAGVFGLVGRSNTTSFEDLNYEPDASVTPPIIQNPFADGNYPVCLTFHQDRLFYGGRQNSPFELNGSRSALYDNFNKSEPPRADDAITISFIGGKQGQVSAIKHLSGLDDLVVLTDNLVYTLSGQDSNDILANQPVRRKPQVYVGAGTVPPIPVLQSLVMVDRTGRRIFNLQYDVQPGRLIQRELTLLVEFLFKNRTMREWAFVEVPEPVFWCVMDDGSLLGMTYLLDENIWAWHEHETDGEFESVAVITENDIDTPYFIVKRTINGATKRYIEKLPEREADVIEDAFYVDCGLTYDGAATSTITGLDHLEGEEVAILADGNVHPRKTVSSGSITLDYAASKVHVGLPYTQDFETLDLEADPQNNGLQTKKRIIKEVDVTFYKSRQCKVGPDADNLTEIPWRTTENYDVADAPYTGVKEVTTYGRWERKGKVFFRNDDPTPMGIAAVKPRITYAN